MHLFIYWPPLTAKYRLPHRILLKDMFGHSAAQHVDRDTYMCLAHLPRRVRYCNNNQFYIVIGSSDLWCLLHQSGPWTSCNRHPINSLSCIKHVYSCKAIEGYLDVTNTECIVARGDRAMVISVFCILQYSSLCHSVCCLFSTCWAYNKRICPCGFELCNVFNRFSCQNGQVGMTYIIDQFPSEFDYFL